MGIGRGLEQLLVNVSASSTTDFFVVVISAVFILAVVQGRRGTHTRFLDYAPAIMISLGILGTFVGIVIGLLNFDVEAIDASIPLLLGGLKTAFLSSLWGMLASILFKGLDAWSFASRREAAGVVAEEIGPQHILSALKDNNRSLERLREGIAGSEEGSLVGQMKLLRTDVGDLRSSLSKDRKEFEERLFKELQNFAELMSRSATEAVVEALRQVIVDFNKNLTEQFGDNFKRLDASVEKLVTWQGNYKEHVESLETQIAEAVGALTRTSEATAAINDSLQSTSSAVQGIRTDCESIPGTMTDLRSILETNQHQLAELERHLQAFVDARDKAVEAVPQIQARLEEVATELKAGAQSIAETMHEGSQEFGRSVDRTTALLGDVANQMGEQSGKISTELKDATDSFQTETRATLQSLESGSKEFGSAMTEAIRTAASSMTEDMSQSTKRVQELLQRATESTLQTMQQSVTESLRHTQESLNDSGQRTLGAIERQVEEATKRTSEALNAQLRAMEQAIEKELHAVFREMGQALATISRRIADDHEAFSKARLN